MFSYTHRGSIFEQARTYTLTSDSLVVQSADGSRMDVPLSEIQSVELEYGGDLGGHSRFKCVIQTGSRTFVVRNTHHAGLWRREPRNVKFRQFVLVLHDVLARNADQVCFTTVTRGFSLRRLAAAVLLPLVAAAAWNRWGGRPGAGPLACCSALVAIPAMSDGRSRYTTDELPHLFLP